jgi:hypothetical protein
MDGESLSHQHAQNIINIHSNYGPVTFGAQRQHRLSAIHSIPQPVEDFVGRQQALEEIGQVLQYAESGARALCSICGMPGIGKTQLAYKLTQQFASLYSEGHILIELRGTSKNPLTPLAALQHVIIAFEPETKLPEDETQVRATYQSLLHGKHVLIRVCQQC